MTASIRNRIVFLLAVAIGATVIGAALAGWQAQAGDIFLSLVSSGLAWCL